MIATSLSLQKKHLAVDPRQFQLPLLVNEIHHIPLKVGAASKTMNRGQSKTPPLHVEFISDAMKLRNRIFIQMHSGTGYEGLPVLIKAGHVCLVNATIHEGSKQTTSVTDLVIELGNFGQVAHVHPVVVSGKLTAHGGQQ